MKIDIFKILQNYSLNDDSIYNIHRTLKSLFRFFKLKNLYAPEILFENENSILKDSILNLESEEIFIVINVWQEFKEQMIIYDELDNILLDKEINNEIKKMD